MPVATLNRTCPFEHHGRNRTCLRSPRIDLMGCKVILKRPVNISDAQFAADIAEIMGWWAINIYPQFIEDGSGFAGVDTIKFEVVGYEP